MWTIGLLGLAFLLAPGPRLRGLKPISERPFKIAIDPGHGGHNVGCLAFDGRFPEKTFTLEVAEALAAALAARLPHAQVFLTRGRDEDVPLDTRVRRANAGGANVLVSIHGNASDPHDQEGFETYVLEPQMAEREGARLARGATDQALSRVSAADPVRTMVRQLELTAQRQAALRLANAIQERQTKRFPRRIDRGVKEGAFDMLMGTRMPSVLVEVGFLDHPREGPQLVRRSTQEGIGEALADALVGFYRTEVQLQPSLEDG